MKTLQTDALLQAVDAKKQQGLPVEGYRPQERFRVDMVNSNKRLEEMMLRDMENTLKHFAVDPRWMAVAKLHLEQGFMALNRAIFRPSRISLPGDAE